MSILFISVFGPFSKHVLAATLINFLVGSPSAHMSAKKLLIVFLLLSDVCEHRLLFVRLGRNTQIIYGIELTTSLNTRVIT